MTSASSQPPDMHGTFESWRSKLPSRSAMARYFDVHDANRAAGLLRAWNASGLSSEVDWPANQRLHVALAGFGTLSYLAGPVASALLADGLVPAVTVGEYNQLFQDLARPDSPVAAPEVNLLWVWADLAELLPADLASDATALVSPAGLLAAEQMVDLLVLALAETRQRTPALLLVNEFVPTRRSPLGVADGNQPLSYEGLYRHANQCLQRKLAEIPAAHVFPLGYQLRRFGLDRALDVRLRLLADCPFHLEFLYQAAQAARPYFRGLKGHGKKVLVLDLDNTLWGGVVGEDGWDGVRIGQSDPVSKSFYQFQKAILELYNRGAILAINSKNNREDVEELFGRREEMLLRPDHFAAMLINWQDKATNCRAIAQEINVGVDSLVFWDDNPAERELVRQSLEEVYVVDVPSDPSTWATLLRECDLLDSLQVTHEDRQRGRMYAEDRLRREAQAETPDLASFLKNLNLEVRVAPADQSNITRIVSLLGRTNQFNLTTRRHGEQQVRQWAQDPDWNVLTFSARDRFGSYGIVGVTMLRRVDQTAEIDSLLLSCRAMGKGVEEVMLHEIGRGALAWKVNLIRGTYIQTKKNAPVKDFLPSHGFRQTSRNGETAEYLYDLSEADLPAPEAVTIVRENQQSRQTHV